MWWGKPGRDNLAQPDPFLCVVQESIREELGILKEGDGLLFRRAEYEAFTTRIWNAKAKAAPSIAYLWGCLLLGQPGIGKLKFLSFLQYILSTIPRKICLHPGLFLDLHVTRGNRPLYERIRLYLSNRQGRCSGDACITI
jgi:hypothetical protein